MARKNRKLSDKLREAIRVSDKSRYRLWQETGVAQETLSRFVNGTGGLSMDGIDKLAEALDLELTPRSNKGR